MHWLGSFAPCAPANPDRAEEKVRRGELPAAQGAGQEVRTYPPGQWLTSPPWESLEPAAAEAPPWVQARPPVMPPTLPGPLSPPCLLGPALQVGMPFQAATLSTPPGCQHSCGLAAPPPPPCDFTAPPHLAR